MPMAKCMKRSKLILMRIYSKPQRLEVPGTGESWGEAWDGKQGAWLKLADYHATALQKADSFILWTPEQRALNTREHEGQALYRKLNKICTPTVEQTEYYLSGGFLSGGGKMAPTKDPEMLMYGGPQ